MKRIIFTLIAAGLVGAVANTVRADATCDMANAVANWKYTPTFISSSAQQYIQNSCPASSDSSDSSNSSGN